MVGIMIVCMIVIVVVVMRIVIRIVMSVRTAVAMTVRVIMLVAQQPRAREIDAQPERGDRDRVLENE